MRPNKTIVIMLWTISLASIGILFLQTYLEDIKEVPQQIEFGTSKNTSHKEILTPSEFKDNFNAASTEFDSSIKIESLNIQTGLYQKTFSIKLKKTSTYSVYWMKKE